MIFPSRRNLVRTVEWNGCTAVRKLFASPEDWQQELAVLHALAGHDLCPKILASVPGVLLLEYVASPTLLDELERQEQEGFSAAPWLALRRWLERVHQQTGLCPGDGNLRNFLWSGFLIHGVDFEGYRPAPLNDALAEIAAYIIEYSPRNTCVKQQASRILYGGSIDSARQNLLDRRMQKRPKQQEASFILLSGGKSTRMKRDKASLPFLGSSLLEFQLDKARLLGCRDILVSGDRPGLTDARCIPDVFPDRGPLGGLHACLREAAHAHCIVLGVDMPLLPVSELRSLLDDHRSSGCEITLGIHDEHWEPLAGVYNSDLSGRIEVLIESSGAPVRSLIQKSACHFRQTQLSDTFWANCNTPGEWQSLFSG